MCPNMNHFYAVDFSECHSEEVMFLLMLSVYADWEQNIIFLRKNSLKG